MGSETTEMMHVLKRFRRHAVKAYGAERLILFGSRAGKRHRKDSDIDLILVSAHKEKLKLLRRLYHDWHIVQKIGYPVDFLCYTPDEFDILKDRVSIVREALREGTEITA